MSTEANALSSYILTVSKLVLYPLSRSGIGWAQSHVGSTQYRLQEQGGGGLGRASLGLILHTHGYFTSLLSSTHTAIRAILNKVANSQPGRQRREEGTKAWQEVSTRSSTWEMSQKVVLSCRAIPVQSAYQAVCFWEALVFRLNTLLLQRQAATALKNLTTRSDWESGSTLIPLKTKIKTKIFHTAHDCL